MKQNNIYLVGFMGSGKTSILKKIKQIVNANTIDLDENIEKKYGSINKIFQTKGEKYFRNIELKTFGVGKKQFGLRSFIFFILSFHCDRIEILP